MAGYKKHDCNWKENKTKRIERNILTSPTKIVKNKQCESCDIKTQSHYMQGPTDRVPMSVSYCFREIEFHIITKLLRVC